MTLEWSLVSPHRKEEICLILVGFRLSEKTS